MEFFIGSQFQVRRGGAAARRRKRADSSKDDLERRVARAEMMVAVGELSSARQALEGEEVAPGTRDTLQKLKDGEAPTSSTRPNASRYFQ